MTENADVASAHHAQGQIAAAGFAIASVLWITISLLLAVVSFSDGMIVSGAYWSFATLLLAPVPRVSAWFNRIGAGRRHRMMLAGAAFVIGLLVIGLTAPDPKPESKAPTKAAPARVAAPPAAMDTRKRDFLAVYRLVIATAQPCDDANKKAVDLLQGITSGRTSMVDAYVAAKDAEGACETAWLSMGKIETPGSLTGDVRADTAKALESCDTAYFSRKKSLEVMMEVVDGDTRPSRVAEYKDQTNSAQQQAMMCILGISAAGLKLGISVKELEHPSRSSASS